jgi:ABC-type glycerol-3-phosphate transport system substrate-binding protein
MTREQKVSYILDYWTVPVIIVAVIVIALAAFLYTMTHQTEILLNVSVVDAPETDSIEALALDFAAANDIPEESVQVSSSLVGDESMEAQASMAFYVRLQAGDEDILVLPEDTFYMFAQNGYFLDLTDVVPQEWQDKILVAEQLYDDYDEVQPDPIPCGIRMRDIPGMPEGDYYEDAVLVISYYPKNYDNAVAFFNSLLAK